MWEAVVVLRYRDSSFSIRSIRASQLGGDAIHIRALKNIHQGNSPLSFRIRDVMPSMHFAAALFRFHQEAEGDKFTRRTMLAGPNLVSLSSTS